jgi:ankyrin repeat protein
VKLSAPSLLILAALPWLSACNQGTPAPIETVTTEGQVGADSAEAELWNALQVGDVADLKTGLAGHPELLDEAWADGSTALFYLCNQSPFSEDLFHTVLEAGADPKLELEDGTTLLMAAAGNASTPSSTMYTLVNLGLNPNAQSMNGLTALHWSVLSKNSEAASVLLTAGADQELQAFGLSVLEFGLIAMEPPADLEPGKAAFLKAHGLLPADPNAAEGFMSVLDVLVNQPVSAVDLKVAGVVESWFAAVAQNDAEAAYKLGTTEWAEHEKDWKSSFSHAFFTNGSSVKAHEIQSTGKTKEGQFEVMVRATLLRSDGSEDGEGMKFTLRQEGQSWLISDLR